ncbi:MAG: hypothetical protein AB1486_24790 [Planctomycetota bacterium]
MFAKLLLLAAALFVGGDGPTAKTDKSPNVTSEKGAASVAATPSPQAQAQLKAAWQIKRASFKKDPAEKQRILEEAIGAFQKVLDDYPQARLEGGEACFRIGEIYRALKDEKRAVEHFTKALEFAESPRFRARSLLELGHIRRRHDDRQGALTFYERVMQEHADQRNEASQAMSWAGKTALSMGDGEKGKKLLLDFEASYPEYPAAAIRNIDRVALWLVEAGRTEEAAALVDGCRERFTKKAETDPKAAPDIHKALARMKGARGEAGEETEASGDEEGIGGL